MSFDDLRKRTKDWLVEHDSPGMVDVVDQILARYGEVLFAKAASTNNEDWATTERRLSVEYDPDVWSNDFVDDADEFLKEFNKHYCNEIACELAGIYKDYTEFYPVYLITTRRGRDNVVSFYTTLSFKGLT